MRSSTTATPMSPIFASRTARRVWMLVSIQSQKRMAGRPRDPLILTTYGWLTRVSPAEGISISISHPDQNFSGDRCGVLRLKDRQNPTGRASGRGQAEDRGLGGIRLGDAHWFPSPAPRLPRAAVL